MTRGSKILTVAVLALAPTACGAHAFTARLGGPSSSSTSTTATTSTSSGSTEDPPLAHAGREEIVDNQAPPHRPWSYLPDGRVDKTKQNGALWTVLAGFTVDEATQRARAAGHTRDIKVSHLEVFDPACKAGTVCRAEPHRWEADRSVTLYLMVNRKVEISIPD